MWQLFQPCHSPLLEVRYGWFCVGLSECSIAFQILCQAVVQTNQVVRHVNNLNRAHSPEVVVARRGQLRTRFDYAFVLFCCKYQCLRLECEVDWVGSRPRGEGDVELQGDGFSGVNFSVASVHRLYRCLTVAGLTILQRKDFVTIGIISDKVTSRDQVKFQFEKS